MSGDKKPSSKRGRAASAATSPADSETAFPMEMVDTGERKSLKDWLAHIQQSMEKRIDEAKAEIKEALMEEIRKLGQKTTALDDRLTTHQLTVMKRVDKKVDDRMDELRKTVRDSFEENLEDIAEQVADIS